MAGYPLIVEDLIPAIRNNSLWKRRLLQIELTGTIDEQHQLRLDEALQISGPQRVRVILLYPLDGERDEAEWLRAAAANPAFADPAEDVYSLADGKPFDDEA